MASVEQDDFVQGVIDGVSRVARQTIEDGYVNWYQQMQEQNVVDYYALGNMFIYEAIHGGLFDRLK